MSDFSGAVPAAYQILGADRPDRRRRGGGVLKKDSLGLPSPRRRHPSRAEPDYTGRSCPPARC